MKQYLVFNKQEWLAYRGSGLGFDFTDDEIEAGLNHPKNLLGIRNGIYCYISKFLQANTPKGE